MPALIGWCCVSAALLVICSAVHASTFLGIDPKAKWPGLMLLHLAIFPPCIAAMHYASRTGGRAPGHQDRVFKSAPPWLRVLNGVFFAYAFVNFGIFFFLSGGDGQPRERDAKYVLQSHGKVLRELTEEEYHRQQAYVVRGFSGHWMLFSCAALVLLVGAAKIRRRTAGTPTQALTTRMG